MNTRNFARTSFAFAALVVTVGIPQSISAADGAQPQFYELRVYTTHSERQQKLVSDYWQNAAIPAYNRMGSQPVGVFTELEDSSTNKIYVLIPFDSPTAFPAIPARLAADSDYQKAAAEYLGVPKSDPAYVRFQSSLLVAFDGMKKLALPPSAAEKKPWLFELRIYESPLIGSQMPCLIYMVSGENRDDHKQHWKGFFDAPVWKKLSSDPQYKDNVSKVISTFLKRTSASQI